MTASTAAPDACAAPRTRASTAHTPPHHPPPDAPLTTAARVTLAAARRKYPQYSVPSPCIGVCTMDDAKGWCAGCFRTLDELAAWSRASDASKLAVWSQVEQRQA